jgi:hypothetical protein
MQLFPQHASSTEQKDSQWLSKVHCACALEISGDAGALSRRAKASAPAAGPAARSAAAGSSSGSGAPSSSRAQTQEAADAAYIETMRKLQVLNMSSLHIPTFKLQAQH